MKMRCNETPAPTQPPTSHLVGGQRQAGATAGVAVRGLDVRAPAGLVGPGQRVAERLVQLQALLAAAVGHAAVQRHVAVVRLRRLVDGQLGLLGPAAEGEAGEL